jgi:hypothetical protein
MRKFIGMFIFCVMALAGFGQEQKLQSKKTSGFNREYDKQISKAKKLYVEKEYKKSALKYSNAFKTASWHGLPEDRYNAARAWALAKIPDSAFYNLQRIVARHYFDDEERILKDEDLNALHEDKRWDKLLVSVRQNKLPPGWYRAGEYRYNYSMFMEAAAGQDGKTAATIKSNVEKTGGFGTLMQSFSANKYLGKRIRMSGMVKSSDVKGWAGLWLRVDQADSKEPLAFDNMQNRPIKGTTDWKKYDIILDVPGNATKIAFGALLDEAGQIWFEKINFEIVDKSFMPTNGEPSLDFEK